MKTLTVRLPWGLGFRRLTRAAPARPAARAHPRRVASVDAREPSVILARDARSPPPPRPRRARRAASADAFSATPDVGEKPQPSNPEAISLRGAASDASGGFAAR